MGFRIFMHSVRLVLSQLNDALRISGLLYLASVLVSGIATYFLLGSIIAGQAAQYPWQYIFVALIIGVIYLWIAVAWHRFVLLDETSSSPLPEFHSDRMLAYFGRFLQVMLVCLVGGLLLAFANGMLAVVTNGNPVAIVIGTVAMITVLLLISYRLAPMFPAAAIGKPIGLGAAWAATSGASGTLLLLALVSAIASIVIDLPTFLFGQSAVGGILSFVWLSVTAWVKLLVGISVLTTIYGVYVEKRHIA